MPMSGIKAFTTGYQDDLLSGDDVRVIEEGIRVKAQTEIDKNKRKRGQNEDSAGLADRASKISGHLMADFHARYHQTIFLGYFYKDPKTGVRDTETYIDPSGKLSMLPYTPDALVEDKYDVRKQLETIEKKPHCREASTFTNFLDTIEQSVGVKRTFSEHGFHIGRLPYSLWMSMYTLWYNNDKNRVRVSVDYYKHQHIRHHTNKDPHKSIVRHFQYHSNFTIYRC